MITRIVKAPTNPQEALAQVKRLMPMLNACIEETEGLDLQGRDALPAEAFAVMWLEGLIDFIECVEGNEEIGVLVLTFSANAIKEEYVASVLHGYVKPFYRGQGVFKRMLDYTKDVLRIRRISHLDVVVKGDNLLSSFGSVAGVVRREEV